MKNPTETDNPFDLGWRHFIEAYRYQLIASFSLLALFLGIFLAGLYVKGPPTTEISVSSSNEATPSEPKPVVVDVSGAVAKPGVYELKTGMRVQDAINEAGGFAQEVDISFVSQKINLAGELKDGQKIYIPAFSPVGIAQQNGSETVDSQTELSGLIDLNSATATELESLPGIGESYARNIIAARPFSSVEDLKNVKGIGAKRFEQLKDFVTVN